MGSLRVPAGFSYLCAYPIEVGSLRVPAGFSYLCAYPFDRSSVLASGEKSSPAIFCLALQGSFCLPATWIAKWRSLFSVTVAGVWGVKCMEKKKRSKPAIQVYIYIYTLGGKRLLKQRPLHEHPLFDYLGDGGLGGIPTLHPQQQAFSTPS